MQTVFNRRTAPKVRDGQVQKKNRHRPTVWQGYILDRESPGRGCHHVLTKRDVQSFIDIIPDFEKLSQRLERIVLAAANDSDDGAYEFFHREETGAIFLNAWPEDLWVRMSQKYFDAHEGIFFRIGLSHDRRDAKPDEKVMCRFTEPQARAFMLLHVFMHELGHHHDRLTQKHRTASRGEDYAERFATLRFEQLYPSYIKVFGDPARHH